MTLTNMEVQIRDPYIVADPITKKYYLFGSTDASIWGVGTGFDVYVGEDLEHWDGPYPVFLPDEAFYSEENFWAPEVHAYQGKYYMFATFLRKDNGRRGTAILVSDSLMGPFTPHSKGPVTPEDWYSLDGTLYLDEGGMPWMVFCHEWVQVADGEVCAVRLTDDLSAAVGDPIVLFRASEAPWTTSLQHPRYPGRENYVTDGTYVVRTEDGSLLILWASFKDNIYAQGIARSLSGTIEGPWVQEKKPIYENDGGHGMIFTTFEGQRMLTLHTPNKTPLERPIFIPITEREGVIRVEG